MARGPDSGSAPAGRDLAIPQFMEIQIKAVFYTAPGFMRWSAYEGVHFVFVREKKRWRGCLKRKKKTTSQGI